MKNPKMLWTALLASTLAVAGSTVVTAQTTPEPRAPETMMVEREDEDMDWGWIGLLGLAGLLGLRRRDRYDTVNRTTMP